MNISDEDYNHAINVFNTFKFKNLLDYSILYLKTDLCHLADIFQKFSNFAYETYKLDCRHSFTVVCRIFEYVRAKIYSDFCL